MVAPKTPSKVADKLVDESIISKYSIALNINGRILNALLDPNGIGSKIKSMNARLTSLLYMPLNRKVESKYMDKPVFAKLVHKVIFNVGDHDFIINAAAIDDLKYDMLLGNDFCKGATIDLKNLKLKKWLADTMGKRTYVEFPIDIYKELAPGIHTKGHTASDTSSKTDKVATKGKTTITEARTDTGSKVATHDKESETISGTVVGLSVSKASLDETSLLAGTIDKSSPVDRSSSKADKEVSVMVERTSTASGSKVKGDVTISGTVVGLPVSKASLDKTRLLAGTVDKSSPVSRSIPKVDKDVSGTMKSTSSADKSRSKIITTSRGITTSSDKGVKAKRADKSDTGTDVEDVIRDIDTPIDSGTVIHKVVSITDKELLSSKGSTVDTDDDKDISHKESYFVDRVKDRVDKPIIISDEDQTRYNKREESIREDFKDIIVDVLPKIEIPERPGYDMEIILKPGAQPVKVKARIKSVDENKEIKEEVKELSSADIVEEAVTEWVSLAFMVKNRKQRRDFRKRMVISYKLLNKVTESYRYPMTNPNIIADKVAGKKFKTVIDFKSGFHLLNLSKGSRKYTGFIANGRLYQFKRAPFGLKNSTAYFNHWVQDVLKEVEDCALAYVDDVIIYSDTEEEHERDIRKVFEILRKNKIFVSKKKIQMFKLEVKYAGHLISTNGTRPLHDKTQAIKEMPYPTTVREIRSFVGSIAYYMRFIPNYAELTAGLIDLTKGGGGPIRKVVLTDEIKANIDKLKEALTSSKTLAAPDYDKMFHVYTDASDVGIGAMITQYDKDGAERPILFDAKKLDKHQRNYDTRDRELLAVVHTLDKYDYMLKDRPFIVYTDHKNLTHLENSRDKSKRLERWGEFLDRFDFDVRYIKGETNYIPDMLSRNSNFYLEWDTSFADDVVESYKSKKKDEAFMTLSRRDDVVTDQNGLKYLITGEDQRLILVDMKQIETVLHEAHATTIGGHVGKDRLGNKLKRSYYWHNFWSVIEKYVKACKICQKCKIESVKQGFLKPLPIPNRPWKDISIDFLTLPEAEDGCNNLLVIVDRFSKMVKLMPCTKQVTAEEAAEWFLNNIVCTFGAPQSIVSDQDSKFTSDLWVHVMKKMGTKMSLTQPGRAQANGQTEIMNKTIKEMITKEANERKQWSSRIKLIEAAINTNVSTTTKLSPAAIVFGFEPKLPISTQSNNVLDDFTETRKTNWSKARDNIVDAQIRQAHYHDRDKKNNVSYEVGDRIMVKRSRLNTAKFATSSEIPKELKLLPIYCGPFKVLEKMNDNNYKIQINNSNKKSRTIHIADTKLWKDDDIFFKKSDKDSDRDHAEEIEKIVAHRTREYKHVSRTDYLVRFEGLSEDHDWWINSELLSDYEDIIQEYRESDLFKVIQAKIVKKKVNSKSSK